MTNEDDKARANGVRHEREYERVKDASLRGAGVGSAMTIMKACIDFGSIVVLARLLTPADFGVVAMAGTVLNLLRIVGDWGLVMASTQRLRLVAEQLSTLFWINTAIGASLSLISIVTAPILALIFNEPRVVPATMVLSVTVFAIGVGAQHEAIMRRRLRYGLLHTLDVVSQAVGLATGVGLAAIGAGLWSLVVYQVVARLVRTAWLWCATRWIPGAPRRGVKIMDRVRYGAQLVPAQLLTQVSRGVAEVLVGASLGAGALGLYRRAHGIAMGVEQLKQPLKAMMPSSLSRLQDRPAEFARFLSHSLTIWCMIACGTVGYIAAEATLVVRVLLGEQWIGAASLLRSLAIAGVATALGSATEWILLPLAEMKSLIVLRIVRTIVVVGGVLVGWRWGLQGIAIGYSVSLFLSVAIELTVVSSRTELSFTRFWAPFSRALVSGAIASSAVLMVSADGSPIVHAAELLLYGTVFIAVHSAMPGGWAGTRTLFRAIGQIRHLVR